ncbi:MAG: VanZ family protein [Novosphingobium sp.]|uniref:VanZ family protein n=1 Tax=Novosphingobium sp. TaxID=1874826 RepID=UPI003C7D206F
MIETLLSPRLMRPLFWLLGCFSLVMALLPKPPSTPIDAFGDKFAHMLAFVVLTIVARLAWPRTPIWIAALLLSLYGAAIELLQKIPMLHRDSDPRDWIADTAAIALALLLAQLLIHFSGKHDTI